MKKIEKRKVGFHLDSMCYLYFISKVYFLGSNKMYYIGLPYVGLGGSFQLLCDNGIFYSEHTIEDNEGLNIVYFETEKEAIDYRDNLS